MNYQAGLTVYEVGKPFPGAVPGNEGAVLELTDQGWGLYIQFPHLKGMELQAFKKGPRRYTYLEPKGSSVPLALWIFDFPAPFGPIDMSFDARLVKKEYIDNALNTSEGVKNSLTIFLLDGNILRGIKYLGLWNRAVNLFHDTIKKQLLTEYSTAEFGRALQNIYRYSTFELLEMGEKFKHR